MENRQNRLDTNLSNPVSRLALVVAKIMLRFNVGLNDFVDLLKYHLVTETKQQDPKHPIVQISARTGLDRREVSKILKNDAVKKKRSRVTVVLQQLRQLCIDNNTDTISKVGGHQSFDGVCQQMCSGALTSAAIANELLRQGHIVDGGRKYRIINVTDPVITETIADHFVARRILNQLVTQCIHQKTKKIDKKTQFDPLVQALGIDGIEPHLVADELILVGCLKDCGDHYLLQNKRFLFSTDIGNFSLIVRELNRLTDTAISNTDKKNRKERKIQWSMYSNQISPQYFDALNKKLERLYDHNNKKTFELLSSYESDVPRGTYPVYGISVYLFEEPFVKNSL